MTIDPEKLLDEYIYAHEMYHIHQFTRDGIPGSLFGSVVEAGELLAIYYLLGKIIHHKRTLNRRGFFQTIFRTVGTVSILYTNQFFLNPLEHQAYTQIDHNSPDSLFSNPNFKFDLFDLEKAR